jgi:hypothetical protein
MELWIAWAPYLIGGLLLMAAPIGRKLVGMVFVLALGLLALLLASEPHFD